MNTPNPLATTLAADGRPRAFSSAATLQNTKDHEKRRKRSRKSEQVHPPTTSTITCSSNSSPASSSTMSSVLRTLVEDDDVYPNKVRPIQVTKEEEEMVRQKTQECKLPMHPFCSYDQLLAVLKSMPRQEIAPEVSANGPLRRLIRDEDLPDEVGPDSPFRHYPKYQVQKLVVFDSFFS